VKGHQTNDPRLCECAAHVEAVVGALNDFGYPFETDPDQTDFRFDLRSKSKTDWHAQLRMTPGSPIIQLRVEVSRPYFAEKREWVAELVNRIDSKIAVLGGFGFDYPSGTAFFRYGVDLRGQTVTPESIERMLNSCAFAIEVFRSAFELIDTPKVSPEKAVDIALMLHDCGEMASHPRPALKAVLRVEKGGDQTEGLSSQNPTSPLLSLI
jgi:hypothetical protein